MRGKVIFLTTFFIMFVGHFFSQNIITWELLKDVEFDEIWSEEFQAYYMVPKFSKSVKEMDGKEVQIRGFIIPVDIVQDYYVLSANPYSSCFFCGQAGPESVMEIQMIKKYGCKKIYFASCAPIIKNTNQYGIYIPTQEELISFQRTEEEIRQEGCKGIEEGCKERFKGIEER